MKVSVIIPVKNGADTLGSCLENLRKQTIENDIEIILLDSMSTDGSREIASTYNAIIYDIPAGTFNHGLTRNFGVQNASGELIYLTVQDAWISEMDMLEKMAAHFTDGAVQSVTGMQATPHELDKNPARWFRRITEPIPDKRFFAAGDFEQLPAKEQLALCRWDNVNSMYRRTALLKLPFAETNLGEDIIWAKQALQKGNTIVRDPSLVVFHYHHHSFRYTFRVKFSEYYVVKKEFKLLPSYPPLKQLPQITYTIIKNKKLRPKEKPAWMLHNFLSVSADFICVFIFRLLNLIAGQKGLDKGLLLFCSSVPQGKQSGRK